ncbi:MAG TPA: glutamine-hydrolyzing carbamoyl-phosphate synthase small subunit [Candidatus Peribacterales bacterium]|nr:glutamine-hydrolyzing carbamoyl-phosphate synthase small subunit [Candidatus Peribacterales bacterium]
MALASLILSDGTVFEGESFGAEVETDGEVVFNTGMVGYPESLTDPSYRGQILVFTYPLIGNYGVPSEELNEWGFSKNFESENIHVRGVICAKVSEDYSHFAAEMSFPEWLKKHNIPGITGVDTRALTKKLREKGVMLGRMMTGSGSGAGSGIEDPNLLNLVAEVSCKEVITYEPLLDSAPSGPHSKKTVVAFDCGMKRNIIRSFLNRGVRVVRVPWDFDLSTASFQYDGVFVSNGPGDPKMCKETIAQMKWAIDREIPTFGICLGNQLLALAIGGDTYKLKYGHRSANQPCLEFRCEGGACTPSHKCIITSQNHGFAVKEELPAGWSVWFRNANDGTIEGIRHESKPFFSIQFHPEACPGPEDAGYLFDDFLNVLKDRSTIGVRK